jgi:protein TonB
MFEGSLVESNHLLHTHSRWTTAVSLALQIALAALLVILPLMHPEALPFLAPKISLLAPPPQAPPPTQPMRVAAAVEDPRMYAPPTQAPIIQRPQSPVGPAPDQPSLLIAMGPGTESNPLLASLGAGPRVVARPAAVAPAGPPAMLKVSTGVAAGMLLAPLRPIYPQIAIATRTQGTVVVQAVISRTGTVESLHVLSGPPLLHNAALQAIREARYTPYRLNGQPVEIETTFSVNFQLAD